MKVAIDCGNAITGKFAPSLFELLGCDVLPIYCDVDGSFPNHNPDPTVPSNLDDLVYAVTDNKFDLGLGFDGDGDRVVAVAPSGRIVYPDELLMIFADDLLKRKPGEDVVFDIKSTRRLNALIHRYGGKPIMWKTGHSSIRSKMRQTGALLGGEFSGHIFFKERWHGFDDGLYAAARLIEVLSITGLNLDQVLDGFPAVAATAEILIPISEDEKFNLMANLDGKTLFPDATIIEIDGIRAEYPKGWGLVRASNTSPNLTMRFEAQDAQHLLAIKAKFLAALSPFIADIAQYIRPE